MKYNIKLENIANNVLSKNTLIPISFAITLIVLVMYNERRLTKIETLMESHFVDPSIHRQKIEEIEDQYMPRYEIILRLKSIETKIDNLAKK